MASATPAPAPAPAWQGTYERITANMRNSGGLCAADPANADARELAELTRSDVVEILNRKKFNGVSSWSCTWRETELPPPTVRRLWRLRLKAATAVGSACGCQRESARSAAVCPGVLIEARARTGSY
ncbi:hypothetical protein [Curtobacterium sp. MCSS17_011]|uniref:hypothetical protein n=1 Tax=Curtobacterium sp. MCSS17_011 TaxID=2175643 RepID=UPI0011B62044|nr:hypothetical protein [Curtobacterium sp. MCSS17_011]